MFIQFPTDIIQGVFSSPKDKNGTFVKAKLQRIEIKNEEVIQLAMFTSTQVFHTNIKLNNLNEKLNELLKDTFSLLELVTPATIFNYKITSKGKLLTTNRSNKKEFVVLEHNKKKNYLLKEGQIIPPLIDLGVMLPNGKICKGKQDKFRQINRFLEIIEDGIAKEEKLRIIDFGCGKSYLTFILYYYLSYVKKIECDIIGLDLKEDVVEHCNEVASKYQYGKLHFFKGDIAQYRNQSNIDMIVTLHACDTATDYALYHAIQMKCKYIYSVPCCQHEINAQLSEHSLPLVSNFGILKERSAAIITDAIRATILKIHGYKTQLLEFVDFTATPKNILIRAVYQNGKKDLKLKEELDNYLKNLNVTQTLYELMYKDKE